MWSIFFEWKLHKKSKGNKAKQTLTDNQRIIIRKNEDPPPKKTRKNGNKKKIYIFRSIFILNELKRDNAPCVGERETWLTGDFCAYFLCKCCRARCHGVYAALALQVFCSGHSFGETVFVILLANVYSGKICLLNVLFG